MQPLDEYALMEWLKGEALKAHNMRESASHDDEWNAHDSRKDAFNEVIAHIQNGRINSRPHVKERI